MEIEKTSAQESSFSFGNKLKRFIWSIVWTLFARPIPRQVCNSWKILLLRSFGAKIHSSAIVYSTAKIYAPWNLKMDANACIGDDVDCYNVGLIHICEKAVVSQKSYLCAASHDISDLNSRLIVKPITIGRQAWVAADSFIGPGVTIGEGSIVGARSAVFKNIPAWEIHGGIPSKFIKPRKLDT